MDSPPEEQAPPVLHAGNFALPADDGAYGSSIAPTLSSSEVFVAVVAFDAAAGIEPGTGLYGSREIPRRVTVSDFAENVLQVRRRGLVGFQRFFTAGERPVSLYAVLGSGSPPGQVIREVNAVLASLDFD